LVHGSVADDQGALSVVVKAIRPMQAPAST
jgi:hypothetical protein